MHALKNSGASLPSEPAHRVRFVELAIAGFLLATIVACAAAWCYTRGYLLYYGDAQSHLNLSRSILDSRTPGYDQLGTVWLPALHLLCLPFTLNNRLWSTGLAGSIPLASCFVVSGVCLYLVARRSFRDRCAAAVVLACFATNPNLLYLAVIPMTEVLFFAALTIFLLCYLEFRAAPRRAYLAGALAACSLMCMTRYDGWFLLPFAAFWFGTAAAQHRIRRTLLFALFSGVTPVYWLAHNWYLTGNALDFFNGPYSAKAIQGNHPYPGLHNWALAVLYYLAAGQLCTGWPLLLIGFAGLVATLRTKATPVAAFLCLTPLFYIWSIHSSGTPIFVPQLYPNGYYNTRYGIAVVLLCAFSAGALVRFLPRRKKAWSMLLPVLALAPWLLQPGPAHWICWKESQVNSAARRVWTAQAADYLQAHYQTGSGILTESGSGDIAGVFCRAAIPLREALHIGNGPAWQGAVTRPDLAHTERWALALDGDDVARAVERTGSPYRSEMKWKVTGADTLTLFRRVPIRKTLP